MAPSTVIFICDNEVRQTWGLGFWLPYENIKDGEVSERGLVSQLLHKEGWAKRLMVFDTE